MRLPREEELYGVLRIIDDALQTLEVGKEEMGTLIGSETTTEADQKSIRIDPIEYRYGRFGITTTLDPLLSVEGADMLDQMKLNLLVCLPDLFIGHRLDLCPRSLRRLLLDKVLAEVLEVELLPGWGSPCR